MSSPLSHYGELPAPVSLADRLVCLWTLQIGTGNNNDNYIQPVLPDGCVDMVWIGHADPIVAGPATRRMLVTLPAGTAIFGIRMQPGWAAACLGLPACELLNLDILLSEIWGRKANDIGKRMGYEALPAATMSNILATILPRLLAVPPPDAAVCAAVRYLANDPRVRIQAVAALTGLSARQLQRRFVAAVGYPPKTFQRIMRLQRLLNLTSHTARLESDLACLAVDTGYADQAHMCREIHALAGKTPQFLLRDGSRSTLTMSDLFNTPDPAAFYNTPNETEHSTIRRQP